MQKLYLIAVPIGNTGEITYLAKEILERIKVIFCEDTRVTKKLLSILKISFEDKKLLRLCNFKEKENVPDVLKYLENEDCALVSDAGYPVISDPGYLLVSELRKRNVGIQVINGPCAFVHAIVCSGIDSRKIYFGGFLSKKVLKRKEELYRFKNLFEEATIVYYESPHFLLTGLELIKEVLGDIKVGVCRELTKLNETFYYDTISSLLKNIKVKGEFVIIIPRKNNHDKKNIDEILEEVHKLVLNEKIVLRNACKVFKNQEYSSTEIYKLYIKKYKN